MRMALPVAVVVSSLAVAAAQTPSPSPSASSAPAASPATAGPPTPSGSPPPYAAEVEKFVAEVQKAIKGKEDQPAKDVFKNVQMLGDVPATRLLRTMQGYTRSIGVSCAKCHVPGQWESDEKDEKGVTRDMIKMTRAINEEYLKQIKALADDKPSVNCMTCHRGQPHPGADLRPARPAAD